MKDWSGAFHVHSLLSDGSGTFSEIVEAALKAGLDFLVLTDHGSMKYRRMGCQGWHQDLLVLVGQETGRRIGHSLVVGTQDLVDDPGGDLVETMKRVDQQGGLGILAHPEGRGKILFGIHDNRWKQRERFPFVGMEVWSFMYDWIHDLHWFNLPYYYLFPEKALKGPRLGVLELWDEMSQVQPTVGIAGLDAHAQKLMGLTAFPYGFLFRTLRTHVLCPEPTGAASEDVQTILDSIRSGHVYFSNDLHWSPKGFTFTAVSDGEYFQQGDSITGRAKVTLSVSLPEDGDIRVLRNGAEWSVGQGRSWSSEIADYGVYRVEVSRCSKPWIYSNPIYVLERSFI